MSRFALVALLVACSSHEPPPPVAAATPVEVPKPPPSFPTETPALAGAEALAFLPDTTHAVGVASSLDQLEAAISPPIVPIVSALTGLPPLVGVSRTRPVGVAILGSGGWVMFGYVDDAEALRWRVPPARLATRGQLAFIADAPDTLAQLLPTQGTAKRAPDLASMDRFRAAVDALHHGALLSWWITGQGTAGLSVDGKTLRVRAVDSVPLPGAIGPRTRTQQLVESARAFGRVPKALQDEQRVASDERDAATRELDAVRRKVIDDVLAQVGITPGKPHVERAFDVPAASVKAWVAPFVERWQASALVAKLRTAEKHVAAIDKQIQRAANGATEEDDEARAIRYADLLTAGPTTPLEPLPHRRPTADLGQVVQAGHVDGPGASGTMIGSGRVGTGPRPMVKLSGTGDAQLRAHLQGRLDRVRTCYDRARERTADLRASVQVAVEADADGKVTAKASGADASLGGCIEVAVRGTAAGAKSVSSTFTIELAPS